MRKCLITTSTYKSVVAGTSDARPSGWITNPPVEGFFHRFVSETNLDGQYVTLAIVEFTNGKLDTVPLAWIQLFPEESLTMVEGIALESKPLISEDILTDIMYSLRRIAENI